MQKENKFKLGQMMCKHPIVFLGIAKKDRPLYSQPKIKENGNFGAIIMKYDASLSFRHDKDGGIVLALHGIRKEPELDRPFFSHQFTEEDKRIVSPRGTTRF